MADDTTADAPAKADPQRKLVQALAMILLSEDQREALDGLEREAALEKRKEVWAADRKTYTKKARQILRKLEKKGAVITLSTEQAD